eukprot:TRINITY_DN370_c0_g2_i2.p1 TRINITY_DN370_c0_g2~~TRINITY_DN370_c0_g2_i2.p1  ORF type:complete len:287 (+),score=21.04 TRINITY_DN370_c0_g2_i2:262-1122(+)
MKGIIANFCFIEDFFGNLQYLLGMRGGASRNDSLNAKGNPLGISRSSHKIGKPVIKTRRNISQNFSQNEVPQSPQPQQPTVYNINKKDFRDLVQLLTGSQDAAPPPRTNRNSPNSRLRKICPPPLNFRGAPNASIQNPVSPSQPLNSTVLAQKTLSSVNNSQPLPSAGSVSWPDSKSVVSPALLYPRYLQTAPSAAGEQKHGSAMPSPNMTSAPQVLTSPSQFLFDTPMPSPLHFAWPSPGSAFPTNFGAFPSPSGPQGFPIFSLPSPATAIMPYSNASGWGQPPP